MGLCVGFCGRFEGVPSLGFRDNIGLSLLGYAYEHGGREGPWLACQSLRHFSYASCLLVGRLCCSISKVMIVLRNF